jgi:hypothetical protein
LIPEKEGVDAIAEGGARKNNSAVGLPLIGLINDLDFEHADDFRNCPSAAQSLRGARYERRIRIHFIFFLTRSKCL